jgi:hypothetical protein
MQRFRKSFACDEFPQRLSRAVWQLATLCLFPMISGLLQLIPERDGEFWRITGNWGS